MDFINQSTIREPVDERSQEFIVADFAAGEYDRVPSFFVRVIPKVQVETVARIRTTVYSIDLHALRLDSLVQAKLETMDAESSFRPDMTEYLNQNPTEMTWLDRALSLEKRIPPESFDLGVLNNDVVGYLHEYYKEHSDAAIALKQVYNAIKIGGLLIVTMPCSLYIVDNVAVLESIGFDLVEGLEIDVEKGTVSQIDRETTPKSMSRLNHYSFLVFSRT
ncbi:MAG: hypothetical protein ACXAB5_05265 [Candidatus Thorarchaeota archaeon]|jgi:hypothetical protein